jgi:predicted nicotinamide N-methyase
MQLISRFKTRIHILDLGDQTIELVAPVDPDALLSDPAVEARYKADNYMPYWPIIWPSGLMMAQRILEQSGTPPSPPPNIVLPRAIELGCGLGTCGIAAAKRGWHVTFTDYDAEAVEFAAHNAAHNGVPAERIGALQMDWRSPIAESFAWVIASDVLYERRLHGLLLDAVDHLLTGDGTAWVSDPLRTSAADFPLAAVERGFRVSTVNMEGKNHAGGVQPGTLYVLTRPKALPIRLGVR